MSKNKRKNKRKKSIPIEPVDLGGISPRSEELETDEEVVGQLNSAIIMSDKHSLRKEIYQYQIASTTDAIEKIEEMVTKHPTMESSQRSVLEKLKAQKNQLEKEMKEKYGE